MDTPSYPRGAIVLSEAANAFLFLCASFGVGNVRYWRVPVSVPIMMEYPDLCSCCCCCCKEAICSSANGFVLRFVLVALALSLALELSPVLALALALDSNASNGFLLEERDVFVGFAGGFELFSNNESNGFGDVKGAFHSRAVRVDDDVDFDVDAFLALAEDDGRGDGAMFTDSDLGLASHRRSHVDSIVDDIILYNTGTDY